MPYLFTVPGYDVHGDANNQVRHYGPRRITGMNGWSEDLVRQTRARLAKTGGGLSMKSLDGRFGLSIGVPDTENHTWWEIHVQGTDILERFPSLEALIAAGWVLD